MLAQFARNGFAVKTHRFFGLPTLGKPGIDVFLQAVDQRNGTFNCRLGLGLPSTTPSHCVQFCATPDDLAVIATVMVEMPAVTPMHMLKTVQKFGRDTLMEER